jgi:L-ascorbate metabolism protein UlaG (beta-lactamase superfamily)
MNRKKFLAVLSGVTAVSISSFGKKKGFEIDFIRHATFILNMGGLKLLVDPMLSNQHEMDAVRNAPNTERIPMLPLPFPESELNERLNTIDAIIVTHTHRDHWDAKAQSILNKEKTVICQRTRCRETETARIPEHIACK